MKTTIMITLLLPLGAQAGDLLNLEGLEFPAIVSQRREADNPYYMDRTVIFSGGRVVLDQPTTPGRIDTEVLPANFLDQQNFCVLKIVYSSQSGFPKGPITLGAERYSVSARIQPGFTSVGPYSHGVNAPIKYYISRPLRSVDDEYQYAQAKIAVAGIDATVSVIGIECTLNGMSEELKDVDDAVMIRAGLGETVSVSLSQ